MGVATVLFISNRWSVKDVGEVITKRFNCPVSYVFHDNAPDFVTVHYKLENDTYKRTLGISTDEEMAGFKGLVIRSRYSESGLVVLEELAKTFGGFLNRSDCSNEFVRLDTPTLGNIDWLVNESVKDLGAASRSALAVVEYLNGKTQYLNSKIE